MGYQSGTLNPAFTDEEYWVFELGGAFDLKNIIVNKNMNGFKQSLKISTLAMLNKVNDFNNLEVVYANCIN